MNNQKKPNTTKQQKIIGMFDDIAPTYDLANRIMSFGVDRQWRKKGCDVALDILGVDKITQVADVACGTGDMLLYWKSRAEKRGAKVGKFVGIDPSVGMLEVAKTKVGFAKFIEGQAQKMPLKDASCDIVSIAYGIRNVMDRKKAFDEFHRVLKSGGIVVILEFTKREKKGFVSRIVDTYMKKALPIVGGTLSKNRAAYTYLPNSIEGFLTTAMLEDELVKSGFRVEHSRAFSFGVSTLVIAKKL